MRAVRRVVTGTGADGRSRVLYDSMAPNVRGNLESGMAECWCFEKVPVSLAGDGDDGLPPFTNHPPQHGAFLRLVGSLQPAKDYEADTDPDAVPPHPPKEDPVTGRGDRGGRQKGRSPIHRTRSVDYGLVMSGRRTLILDDGPLEMSTGDIVVQLGNYHQWANDEHASVMAFVMIGGSFAP